MEEEIKTFSSPRLTAEDKLYVRAYLSTLSHKRAHEITCPDLKSHQTQNQFAKKDAVKFHIAQGLQERAESISLTPEVILEKLFKEATREGPGSNHAARIQALTQLGKHFGLFEEKKGDTSHTFNIINYSTDPIKLVEAVEQEAPPEPLLENIEIKDYAD